MHMSRIIFSRSKQQTKKKKTRINLNGSSNVSHILSNIRFVGDTSIHSINAEAFSGVRCQQR